MWNVSGAATYPKDDDLCEGCFLCNVTSVKCFLIYLHIMLLSLQLLLIIVILVLAVSCQPYQSSSIYHHQPAEDSHKSQEENAESQDAGEWGVSQTTEQYQIDVRLHTASSAEPPKSSGTAFRSQKSVRFHGAGR